MQPSTAENATLSLQNGNCINDSVKVDDGISGSKWERSGFQQMLRAIEDGWINLVLVKDLSRLSRDYIRTGELIERWFPAHSARLIAVNDGLDTANDAVSNDYSAIRAVMDDWYARDISHKVRAAIRARQNAGICTAAHLPYGYRRSGQLVVIAEEQAETVRQIFQHYLAGESCCGISRMLTDQSIAPPSEKSRIWHDATVRRILSNPAYIGKLHLHSTQTYSYKCSKKRYLLPDDRIIYPVPPIISESVFLDVQQRLTRFGHSRKKAHFLSDKVVCGCCGEKMHFTAEHSDIRLICGGRKRGSDCRNASLLMADLLHEILSEAKKQGIAANAEMLPMLISGVTVGDRQIDVFLQYRLPDENGAVC